MSDAGVHRSRAHHGTLHAPQKVMFLHVYLSRGRVARTGGAYGLYRDTLCTQPIYIYAQWIIVCVLFLLVHAACRDAHARTR